MEGAETPSAVHGGSDRGYGPVLTGRRSKKPTEKETGAVDVGTMMTDDGMVTGIDSGLGELILGYRGVSAVSLLHV